MTVINNTMFQLLSRAGVFDSQRQALFNDYAQLAKDLADSSGTPDTATKAYRVVFTFSLYEQNPLAGLGQIWAMVGPQTSFSIIPAANSF